MGCALFISPSNTMTIKTINMRIKFLFLISILFSKTLLAVPESFADLVEQLSPAVVSIASTTIVENNNQNQIPQFPEGSPFDDFFK